MRSPEERLRAHICGFGSPFALLALFILGLASVVSAQEFRGTLSGHVTDPSSALVPNATIVAVNTDTQLTYSGSTTVSGSYQIPYILPGTYTVIAKAEGFKTVVREGVVLLAGESSTLDFKLAIGTITESVTVSATAPLMDAETAVGNGVITTRELENLPITGRQVFNLIGRGSAGHALDRRAPIHLVQATLEQITTGRYLHARPTESSSFHLPD